MHHNGTLQMSKSSGCIKTQDSSGEVFNHWLHAAENMVGAHIIIRAWGVGRPVLIPPSDKTKRTGSSSQTEWMP